MEKTNKKYLEEIIRVDHAGERGAIKIYEGQLLALKTFKQDEYLKQKIEAGADYIVTQLFYDNQKFKDFVDLCREEGITVPIIPGIKPISTKKQILALPKFFHIDLPDELVDAIDKCETNEEVKQVGIDWCIKQCRDLIDYGVPCIHYYTMGKSLAVREVVKEVFGK